MHRSSQKAFTLIEMSIVLIIIAFLIAASFGVVSLIRVSQINAMLGEYDDYVKGLKEFQDKYLALPGDMVGAEALWGSDPGGCPCIGACNTPTSGTCDGDGNGTIGSSDTAGGLSSTTEWFRAWQQLAEAGFLRTTLAGSPGPGGAMEALLGTNVPVSKLQGAGWTILYYLLAADPGPVWGEAGGYGHILALGGAKSAYFTVAPVLLPQEAASIDQKIDDGQPGTGKVRAWRTSLLPDCTANDTSQTAQSYNMASDYRSCSLLFLLGF